MSEYQYYRFEAIDSRLATDQMKALRRISTRATITATSFQNEYHYGDLKAEPVDLMLGYFDIGIHYADWGAIEAYFKFPLGSIPHEFLASIPCGIAVYESQDYELIAFEIEERYEYFDDEDAERFFQHFSPLRDDLLKGDWRLLYLFWLRGLDFDDEIPSVPLINFDFCSLPSGYKAFIDTFDISKTFINALKLVLAEHTSHTPEVQGFDTNQWLDSLTEAQKSELLTVVMEEGSLSRRQALAMTQSRQSTKKTKYQHWLSTELLMPYIQAINVIDKKAQLEADLRKVAEEKAAIEAELVDAFERREQLWQQAQTLADKKNPYSYDNATALVNLLFDAHQLNDTLPDFVHCFSQFIEANSKRSALLGRVRHLIAIVQSY